MKNDKQTKKMIFLAMCLSAALVLSYVEAIIPVNIGIPGAKLGLPNIVTLMLLYALGPAEAIVVSVMRILLSGFMFGNLFAILYSAAGFILSFFGMFVLKKTDRFSMVGVSVAGGVLHNAGQILTAVFLTNAAAAAYLPVLAAAGTVAGIFIGILGGITMRRVARYLQV